MYAPPSLQGQWLIIGSIVLGMCMTLFMGWFTESEDEAREKGGWLRIAMNGQANIHKLCRYAGLYALLHSCPNPDYGALVIILFALSDQLYYLLYRTHMYIHRSPDTSRYLSYQTVEDDAPGGKRSNAHTEQALNDLREYVNRNPDAAHRLSERGGNAFERFRSGAPHVWTSDEDEAARTGQGRRSGCSVQ